MSHHFFHLIAKRAQTIIAAGLVAGMLASMAPAPAVQAAAPCRSLVFMPAISTANVGQQQVAAAEFPILPIPFPHGALQRPHADLNGDGCDDLIVGVPLEDIESNSKNDGGAVNIIYGSYGGLTAQGSQIFAQSTPGMSGASEAGDNTGVSVTAGDFNGDGYMDVAAGAPGEDIDNNTKNNGGAVVVLYGGENGVSVQESQIFAQGALNVAGAAESGDMTGFSLAAGDFDGDGYDDLAAGTPFEDIDNNTANSGGAVVILYGSEDGLMTDNSQIFSQATPDVAGAAEAGDQTGYSLTAGDFNGDDYMDLAAGAPGEDIDGNSKANGGAVLILYGSKDGLKALGSQIFDQSTPGVKGAAEAHDMTGHSVSAGDFNGDGYDDLAAGAPGEDIDGNSKADGGAMLILYGSKDGLQAEGSQIFDQSTPGVKGAAEAGDRTGWSVTTGDFNGDGYVDLAAGAPTEDIDNNSKANGGAVLILYGSENGLEAEGSQMFAQDSPGVKGSGEADDRTGWSVTTGDYNGDGYADLAAGAPTEDIDNNSKADGGAVLILYGSQDGLTAQGSQVLSQATDGIAGAPETDDKFGYAIR